MISLFKTTIRHKIIKLYLQIQIIPDFLKQLDILQRISNKIIYLTTVLLIKS